jgi:hypothetical protein
LTTKYKTYNCTDRLKKYGTLVDTGTSYARHNKLVEFVEKNPHIYPIENSVPHFQFKPGLNIT